MTDRARSEADREWLALGTSTIYEASGLPCALTPDFRSAWPTARLCGPAYTVECMPGDNLAIHRALETTPAGSVLVVQGWGVMVGYWGEVLARAAQHRDIAGLLIDGGVRDVEALEAMGFPVFSRGISMLGTSKFSVGQVGSVLDMGGVRIAPGSLIVGDCDGVLALPADEAPETLLAARSRQNEERGYMKRIVGGELTVDIFGWRHIVSSGTRTGQQDVGSMDLP